MKTTTLALIIASTITVTGCASIVSGSSKPVVITSTPEGQPFSIQNKHGQKIHSGVTPATVNLSTGAGFFQPARYTITYSPDSTYSQVTTANSSLNPWYLGNIIFGGALGILLVDPATGAMWSMPQTISNPSNAPTAIVNTPIGELSAK